MKRYLLIMILLCVVFCGISPNGWSKDFGTVLSVVGDVRIQTPPKSVWNPLKSGNKIKLGDVIKTEAKALVRLLNPDGSLMKIQENQKQIYGGTSLESAQTKSGWKTALIELFGSRERKRIAATRGSDSKGWSLAMHQQQPLWTLMMRQSQLSPADMEPALEMAALYSEEKWPNRSVAVLWKLKESFLEQKGFHNLALNALEAWTNQVEWQVYKSVDGEVSDANSGDIITEGNGLQIRYRSGTETYYYLFFTTHAQNGHPQTMPIFPSSFTAMKHIGDTSYFESRIAPEKTITLPSANGFYPLDNMAGTEHLWGWSCAGPVISQARIQKAITAVEHFLSDRASLPREEIVRTSPPFCSSVFALSLIHQ